MEDVEDRFDWREAVAAWLVCIAIGIIAGTVFSQVVL